MAHRIQSVFALGVSVALTAFGVFFTLVVWAQDSGDEADITDSSLGSVLIVGVPAAASGVGLLAVIAAYRFATKRASWRPWALRLGLSLCGLVAAYLPFIEP